MGYNELLAEMVARSRTPQAPPQRGAEFVGGRQGPIQGTEKSTMVGINATGIFNAIQKLTGKDEKTKERLYKEAEIAHETYSLLQEENPGKAKEYLKVMQPRLQKYAKDYPGIYKRTSKDAYGNPIGIYDFTDKPSNPERLKFKLQQRAFLTPEGDLTPLGRAYIGGYTPGEASIKAGMWENTPPSPVALANKVIEGRGIEPSLEGIPKLEQPPSLGPLNFPEQTPSGSGDFGDVLAGSVALGRENVPSIQTEARTGGEQITPIQPTPGPREQLLQAEERVAEAQKVETDLQRLLKAKKPEEFLAKLRAIEATKELPSERAVRKALASYHTQAGKKEAVLAKLAPENMRLERRRVAGDYALNMARVGEARAQAQKTYNELKQGYGNEVKPYILQTLHSHEAVMREWAGLKSNAPLEDRFAGLSHLGTSTLATMSQIKSLTGKTDLAKSAATYFIFNAEELIGSEKPLINWRGKQNERQVQRWQALAYSAKNVLIALETKTLPLDLAKKVLTIGHKARIDMSDLERVMRVPPKRKVPARKGRK